MRYNIVHAVVTFATDVIIHPQFTASDRWNNIAIIVIEPLPLNTRNMEARNISMDFPIPNARCEIYGFGHALSLAGPPQMLMGIVQVFDNSACRDHRDNIVCAGEDTYPCNGDEGEAILL